MELRINCNEAIQLDKFISMDRIESEVSFFEIKNDTLTGDVKLFGEYKKQGKEDSIKQGFEEIIPFTVVFRTKEIDIQEISIEHFSYHETEQGIDCQFEIFIQYEAKEKEDEESSDSKEDESIEIPVETKEEIIEVIHPDNPLQDEANKITEEYENILEDILQERTDNFLEQNQNEESTQSISMNLNEQEEKPSKENNVDIVLKKTNEKVSLHFKHNEYKKVQIYYTYKDSDIEAISKKEHYPVDQIYRENSDYQSTRRIILK